VRPEVRLGLDGSILIAGDFDLVSEVGSSVTLVDDRGVSVLPNERMAAVGFRSESVDT
jgi:hypothetical protein